MAVTTTPYGASRFTTSSFNCLLSAPDTGELNNIVRGRHVPRSSTDTSLLLPDGTTSNTYTYLNFIQTILPTTLDSRSTPYAQGVYYCEATSTSRTLTTRVPITILSESSKYFNRYYSILL